MSSEKESRSNVVFLESLRNKKGLKFYEAKLQKQKIKLSMEHFK